MLAIRDAAIVSTSGRPSAGPLCSRTRMAWFTSWWLAGSDSYSSSRKASTAGGQQNLPLHTAPFPRVISRHVP
jgi:hypothetical protein